MNRRQRRAAKPRAGTSDIERAAACPDCDAEVTVREVGPHVYRGVVEHSECCPWYATFRRNGGMGVRFR